LPHWGPFYDYCSDTSLTWSASILTNCTTMSV
jgi:hypothetical protein